MWNLEGKQVTGTYLDEFPVVGRVWLSRVAYGGTVQHHVTLDEPLKVYGRIANVVILKHCEVETVKDLNGFELSP